MKKDDRVRVWPHGDERNAAEGTVVVISENGKSIAVGFPDRPPFAIGGGMMIHPEHGIMFLATRLEVGPWVEVFGEGHYEIEDA